MPYKVKLKNIAGAKWSLSTYKTRKSAERAVKRYWGNVPFDIIKRLA